MILLSSRKLERVLGGGKLDAGEKLKYLMFPTVLGAVLGSVLFTVRPHYGQRIPTLTKDAYVVCGFLSAYLVYRGIKRCFETNRAIDSKAFFERFAVLLVPPMLQVGIASVVLSLVVGFGAFALRERVPHVFDRALIASAAFGPLAVFVMYSLLNRSFRRLGKIVDAGESESC